MEVYVRKSKSRPPFEVIAALVAGILIGFAASYFLFDGESAPPAPGETPVAAVPPPTSEPVTPPSEEPPAVGPAPSAQESQPATPPEPAPPAAPDLAKLEDVWPARHLFIAVQGKKLDTPAKEMLGELKPGGVVLRGDNFKDKDQLVALIADVKAAVGLGTTIDALPLIAVAQEGGALNVLNLKEAPSAAKIGAAKDLEAARAAGAALGQSCVDRGIGVLLGPVLDITAKSTPKDMQARCFGDDHQAVAAIGLAYTDGLVGAGVLPVVKHFPGMGTIKGDSQKALATLDVDQDRLSQIIFPFNEAARCNVPGILVGHVVVPALDNETQPVAAASLSPKFLKALLRDKWNYPGVILADDVNKASISKSLPVEKAAVAALAAGNDAVLMLSTDLDIFFNDSATTEKAAVDGALDRAALSESKKRLDAWRLALESPRAGLDGPLPPLPQEKTEEAPPAQPAATPEPTAPVQPAATEPAPTGPAAVEPPSEEPSVQPPANTKAVEYVVKSGDFLSSIATKHKVDYHDIMTWNHLNNTNLSLGQKLTIYVAPDFVSPDAATPAPAEAPKAEVKKEDTKQESSKVETPAPNAEPPKETSAAAAPAGDTEITYTVKKGDNLANIGAMYGVTADDVRGWNGIEGNRIDVGQQLKIRPKKMPAQ